MDDYGIESLTDKQYEDIINCIQQHLYKNDIPKEPFVITVWFHDVANKYLHTNTKYGSYAIYNKLIGEYTKPYIISTAKEIWNNNFVPIEIIQMTGAYFYASHMNDIFNKKIIDMSKAE